MRLTTMRLSRIITLLLLTIFLSERVAIALPTPDAATARLQVAARGVGKGIKVHELDGTVVHGKIASVKEDSFSVEVGSGRSVEIAYANVRAVEKHGLSTGAKVGIGIGIGIAVSAVVVWAWLTYTLRGF
jgi:preprotein translocase subunit YajC